jgi:hypothetical protein
MIKILSLTPSHAPIKDLMEDTESQEKTIPADIAYAMMRKKEIRETNFPTNTTLVAKHQQNDVNLQKR